jgi:hypothetical protein
MPVKTGQGDKGGKGKKLKKRPVGTKRFLLQMTNYFKLYFSIF